MKQEEKFLRVGIDLLGKLNPSKTYQIQLALTLLYLVKPQYEWYEDECIVTTPSLLIKQFGCNTNINRRQQANVIEALEDLQSCGLIKVDGDLNFKGEILIDCKELLMLSDSKGFVRINIDDFITIMQDEEPITIKGKEKSINGVESLLLTTLININGSFNYENLEYLKQFDNGEVARDISSDTKLQNLKYIFCNYSLEYIRTHKHPNLITVDKWIDEDYLTAMIGRLIKLNIIVLSRKKVLNKEGKWINMNFYYPPIFSKENMDIMIISYAKRMNYAIKNNEE